MNNASIIIVDYGMGNLRSVMNKINLAGYEAEITSSVDKIKEATKLILPGVGHFLNGMKNLRERNLVDILNEKVVRDKIPIFGICLGMQLFTRFSEEGNAEGLSWLDAQTVKFKLNDIQHKVPHIGWNTIEKKQNRPLLKDTDLQALYYFVHSYHVVCNDPDDILATTIYGYEFTSAVQRGNIFGTQFHPEKSHEWGENILSNFLNI
jgi:imidazole glycerol-phosphate synthase subunit HisH